MRKYLQIRLYELSHYVEIIISIILVISLLVLTGRLALSLTGIFTIKSGIDTYLQSFLNQAMSIAIGVELIKMLSKHTSGTIIEVLLFAIARQIVVAHGSAKDSLLSVIALAILFATRKYLFTSFDDTSSIIVRGSQKVKIANVLARVELPVINKNELMRDLMLRHLEEEGKTVYQSTAKCITDVPDKMSTYLKQQNRWNKSFFRESIISVKKIMNNPFVALWTILEVSMFMMLVYSVVDFFVGNVREFDWLRVLAFLVIIFIVALCRNIHYMLKHPLSFLLSPFYGVLHLFVLQPLKLYSLFTIRNADWGTRKKLL